MPKIPRKKRKRKRHPLYPEPGASVLDSWDGLPKMKCPQLIEGMLSVSDVADLVSYEGLGYCIFTYIPSGKIKDRELGRLWEKARKAMVVVLERLDTP